MLYVSIILYILGIILCVLPFAVKVNKGLIISLVILLFISGTILIIVDYKNKPEDENTLTLSENQIDYESDISEYVEVPSEDLLYELSSPLIADLAKELGIYGVYTIDKSWSDGKLAYTYYKGTTATTVFMSTWDGHEMKMYLYGSRYHKGFPGILFNSDVTIDTDWEYVEDQLLDAGVTTYCKVISTDEEHINCIDALGDTYICDKRKK